MKHKTEEQINRDCREFVQLLMKSVDVVDRYEKPTRIMFSADWGEPTLTIEYPVPNSKEPKLTHRHFGIPNHEDYLRNFELVVGQMNNFLREYIKEWDEGEGEE